MTTYASAIEAAARMAETWQSSLRPGSPERLAGHKEAACDIAAAIRAFPAPEPAAVTGKAWMLVEALLLHAFDDCGEVEPPETHVCVQAARWIEEAARLAQAGDPL
jgi:hypothetical protein